MWSASYQPTIMRVHKSMTVAAGGLRIESVAWPATTTRVVEGDPDTV
jgi:hypothetical protein